MKKNVSFLAASALAFSLFPSLSHAQSAITLYGWADIGIIRETGHDWRLDELDSDAFGIRGYEDLGGGNKVTFNLETRFALKNGQNKSLDGAEWDGASNIGLAGYWGGVRFGRMNEIPTETFRLLDPFSQNAPAGMLSSSQRATRISNTVRYDSPALGGFHLRASYTVKADTRNAEPGSAASAGADNAGYAASLEYDHGDLHLTGNWSRLADSNQSSQWNLGGAWQFGPVRLSAGYARTRDRGWRNGGFSSHSLAQEYGGAQGISSRQDSWLAGMEWTVGAGRIKALFNYTRLKDVRIDGTGTRLGDDSARKYALGYVYHLSKRTEIYTMVSYADFDSRFMSAFYHGVPFDDRHTASFQLGMLHFF